RVPDRGFEGDRAACEHAAAMSQHLSLRIDEHRFGEKEPAARMQQSSLCAQLSARHGPREVDGERHGRDEHVSSPGICGEEGGVVEGTEVQRAMHGAARMIELWTHRDPHFRLAVADRDRRPLPTRDRSGVVHPLEFAVMVRVGHYVLNTKSVTPAAMGMLWLSSTAHDLCIQRTQT